MPAEPELLEADRVARTAALDVTRSFIVQAPAGSGKTELLIQRYLNLLSTVGEPEEILAITFTRKAAIEMQTRVVAALRDAKEGGAPREAHERVTLAAATRVLAHDERNGWRLAESPQRMRIQTIDSLNSAIARAVPVGSGLGANVEIVQDETAQAIYRRAATATLDWLVSDSAEGAAVERLLVHLDNSVPLYVDHLAGMLQTRDQWLGITGTGPRGAFDEPAVRARLERMIAEQVTGHLVRLRGLFPTAVLRVLPRLGRYAAASLERESGPAHALGALAGRHELPSASWDEIDAWRALADLLLTRDGDWRRTVNRSVGLPPRDDGEKAEMLATLERLAGHDELASALHGVRQLPEPNYPEAQWQILLALIRLLPLAVGELRRTFAEQRVADYIEVALAAHAALGSMDDPGDIALLLDYGITHLLVDEMQDTSIAQYQLLEKLVAGWQPGDGRTLFCVGDPMQSVYRFRNAEVGEFLLARTKGVGGVQLESLVLRRNFRSGQHLVHWFNEVFAEAFPQQDDVAAGAISYTDAVPVEAHAGQGVVRIHPMFGPDPRQEAEQGIAALRECLDGTADDSVALLVRSRNQLTALLPALRSAGIPYRAVDLDRLTDLPEILDLLALTRALCHRDDRIAWLGLLRGPWIGLTWADLHALVVGDTRSTVCELLQREERLAAMTADGRARACALLEFLAPFLRGHGTRTLGETVEEAWYRLGGPGLLEDAAQAENVYRFLDVLARLDFAGTLRDVAVLEDQLDQERVAARGSAGARLQVMTMHRAKGLQFDHVVLYGLGRRTSAGSKPVLNWLDVAETDGSREFLVSPLGARTQAQSDPLHDLIESRLRRKEELEQVRLLYVACTRARRSLHLVGHVPLAADGSTFRAPPPGSLLRKIWRSVEPQFAGAFTGRSVVPKEAGARAVLREPVLDRLPAPGPRPSLPPFPGGGRLSGPVREVASQPLDRPIDYRWVGAAARHTGSIVHRCLQQIADGLLGSDVDVARLEPLVQRWAGELGIAGTMLVDVQARAREAIARVLEDPAGRWLLFGPGRSELPLSGVWRGRLVSVVLDRVRIDDAGVHWVVDYKVGAHEGGDLERFLAQERERYRPQLERYVALYRHLAAAPVRAALYFPLLQRFVEIPADA